jgi:radical SAM protein with 4Fe4S-binding SPASM domain
MHVNPGVFVVTGRLRSALYLRGRGQAVPLSPARLAVLRSLADGALPSPSALGLPRSEINLSLRWLLDHGAIGRGARGRASLAPPIKADASLAPEAFSHVWLEMTNSCNLTCQHCYAGSSPTASRTGELTAAEWIAVCDKLVAHGTTQLTFIGGEPLVRKHVVREIALHLRRTGSAVKLRIFSNLTILPHDEDWLAFFADAGIHFGTSLYGHDADTHDGMTRMAGSWRRTVDNIRRLRAAGLPVFAGYYFKAPPDDAEHAAAEAFLRDDLGLTEYAIETPAAVGRAQAMGLEGERGVNTLPAVKWMSEPTDHALEGRHNCFADVLTVKPDGTITPCIMQREHDLGNLVEQPLDALWANAEYQRFRALSKDSIDGCRECEFRYACFDCRPAAIGDSGDLLAKPDCGYDPRRPLGAPLGQSRRVIDNVVLHAD